MSTLRSQCAVTTSILLFTMGLVLPVCSQTAASPLALPDATLFTSYIADSGYQNINWVVCGSTKGSEGCYSSGRLGPFGQAGALMEGSPSRKKNTVTRNIYVVDTRSGSGGGVTLYVYQKTDTVTSSFDTAVTTLTNTIDLPLVGGSTALCSMAANSGFLFIGTDQSPLGVEVQKSDLSVTEIGGFSPPINVTSITGDPYGYVTVTFGGFTTGESGIYQYGPDGLRVDDGGGAEFMLNTVTGISTATLPTSDFSPSLRLGVRRKTVEEQDGSTK